MLLGQHDGIADVRGDVVAARLEAQPPTLLEGLPEKARRAIALDRILRPGRGMRPARDLIALAVPLKQLHHGLNLGIAITPVRSHVRPRSMRGADAFKVMQVGKQVLDVGRAVLRGSFDERLARHAR